MFRSSPQPMWGSHNPTPLGPNIFASTHSLLQRCGPLIHPPLRPNVLVDTPPRVHLLQSSAFSLAHRPVSSFDTICNNPSSPLANIVRFGPLRTAISLVVLKHVCISTHLQEMFCSPLQPMRDLTKIQTKEYLLPSFTPCFCLHK